MTINNSIDKNKEIIMEKNARIKFIVITIFLILFLFSSLALFGISHRLLYDEIKMLNNQFYGTITITMWLPFFLFFATIYTFSKTLEFKESNRIENNTSKLIFRSALEELHKPTNKKNMRRKVCFWILLVLSFMSMIFSLLYLFLGIAFLV
ncbi:MAG: hypothetical protein JXA54_03370 [Candidatus Heimdallarchaeota archaeon]|nr:hypothetical protein [Candidatus Heimdallarchaeota archaeon]